MVWYCRGVGHPYIVSVLMVKVSETCILQRGWTDNAHVCVFSLPTSLRTHIHTDSFVLIVRIYSCYSGG